MPGIIVNSCYRSVKLITDPEHNIRHKKAMLFKDYTLLHKYLMKFTKRLTKGNI